VRVTYNDGSVEEDPVTWNDDDVRGIGGPGRYEVTGATATGLDVTGVVVVRPVNLLRNGSFEDADTSMWTITGDDAAIQETADAFDGARAVQFWAPEPYEFAVSQRVEGVEPGLYRLSATTQGADSP